jgi:hypothetical protein
MASIPVYDWLHEGRSLGCGSEREFRHWQAEGVVPEDATLGAILCHEPASEDERRELAWAA